ncbi:ribbon-helix-helix protein, CopG family [Enterococcus sp. AZ134]|uniref:ribbon-helix-helix protein, CopG family n=1 Tax=unclassified Enterococcus TaxID=2608891 RepID=UPI003F2756A8
MGPRTGRPKKENPLNIDVKVRIDKEMDKKIKAYAEKHGLSRTEVIRKGIKLILGSDK